MANQELDKKTQKAIEKEKKGKSLSKKERERLQLLQVKYRYKIDKEYALRLKNVQRSFGLKKVLKGVTLEIKKGERVALIGKNGSGKSTLINILSQQLRMSKGDILYGYAKNRVESLEFMGIQFQTLNYPEGFVVKDVIHFFNSSVEKSIRMSKRELSDMVVMFGIDKYYEQKIDRLSGGQQQRVNVLLALIKRPKLLILDEISTGLDVESAEKIKSYIDMYLKKNPETALLLISHSDEEIREMTTRTYVLEAGKIVEEFESKELNNKKFLQITSRDPKLTKKEQEEQEKASAKYLKSLNKRYNIKESSKLSKSLSNLSHKLSKKFQYIDNSQIAEGNAVEIRDVSKTYNGKVGAVRNFNLDIKEGERISITGPNGSGKTTIVEIIAQVKGYDKKSEKFKNMYSLAEVDYKRELYLLEESISQQLRAFRNEYRLHRDLVHIEIETMRKELQEELRATRKRIVSRRQDKSTQEVNLQKKQAVDKKKAKVEKEIEKMLEQLDVYIERKHKAYNKLEQELNSKLDGQKARASLKYDIKVLDIMEQERKAKKDPNFNKVNEFIKNGEVIPVREYSETKPSFSYSFAETPRQVKDQSGVQFQYASFPVEMTVQDVILFFARTNRYFMNKEEIIDAIKVFKLEKLLKSKAYRMSGGERQRLNVLLAIMKSPKLLILDEISTGLDVDSIVKIDEFIKEYLDRTNATLILISHNYNEVHSLTDKIVVMRYGELSEINDIKGWTLKQVKDKMRDIYKGGGI